MKDIKFYFLTILQLSIISLFLVFTFVYAQKFSIHIPTFHLDGAFQTASSLFRLDSFQLPGRDFFPYLGIGPNLVIYPFFKLFGGNMASAVLASFFTTIICLWISLFVLCHLIFKPKSLLFSFATAAVIVTITMMLLGSHSYLVQFFLAPGNSLKPIRSFIPYSTALFSYLIIFNTQNKQHSRGYLIALLAGVMMGFVMLWSNDYAIVTTISFSCFFLAYFYFNYSKKEVFRYMVIYTLIALASWMILLTLITAGDPIPFLKYNYVYVRQEQWWFFSPYDEKGRIFSLLQLKKIIYPLPLLMITLTLIFSFMKKNIEYALVATIGLALYLGGALSAVGGHITGAYFIPIIFWSRLVIGLFLLYALSRVICKIDKSNIRVFLLSISSTIFLAIASSNSYIAYNNEVLATKNRPNLFFVPELGGYLPTDYKKYIDFVTENSDKKILEEYWGLWSVINRVFGPWPVDSIIHAFGPIRKDTQEHLNELDFIITTHPYLSYWHTWNFSQSFWLFDELLTNWEPHLTSPTTIVWQKSMISKENNKVNCSLSPNRDGFFLETEKEGYYKVNLRYKIAGKGRHLVMIKNGISLAEEHVSLDIHASEITMPVFVQEGQKDIFGTIIRGNKKTSITLESCSAETLNSPKYLSLLGANTDNFYLTDDNWTHGVSTIWPGFFVYNSPKNHNKYALGNQVHFQNGEAREIIKVEKIGRYLYIHVSGEKLNPELVGIPNTYEVKEPSSKSKHDN